ncbi:MAG: hypothetical protein IMZ69_07230 [Spirochaetes bacterium]|nr:hypothetical protein [Spirochaetota bacterium]
MRTSVRNAAFLPAAALALLIGIGASALLAVFLTVPSAGQPLSSLPDHPWWFVYPDAPRASGEQVAPDEPRAGGSPLQFPSPLWSIAAAIAATALALPASFRARALIGRASSPIAAFLVVFFLSLCLEGLRVGAAFLVVTGRSIPAAVVLTRAVYGGRFLGILALLAAGLYCMEMKYAKHLLLALGALAVSFAMAASIPIDRTVFVAQLTYKLGDEQGLWFVSLVLGILVLAAGAGAALVRRDRRFLILAGGSALLLAGREILFFSTRPAILACGLALLSGGTVLWLRGLAVILGDRRERVES